MKGAMAAVRGSFGLTAGAIAGFEATKRKITETTISLTALEGRYERMVHTMGRAVPALPAPSPRMLPAVPALPAPSSRMLPAVPKPAKVLALPPAAASSAMLPALPAPSSVPTVPALPQPATAQQNKAAQPMPKPTQKPKPSMEQFEQFVMKTAGRLFDSAKSMAQASIGAAWEHQAIKEQFALRLGNADAGVAMFDRFRQEALQAGADAKEYLAGSLNNLAVTRDATQASQLNRFARQLSLFDSQGGGLGGSFAAVQAAAQGDVGSLSGRFGVSESLIQQFNIEELAKSGDMSGFIAAFDQMLEAANMGQAALDSMLDSPTRKLEALQNNIQTMFAQAGEGAIQAFAPVIDTVSEMFANGQFQGFFDLLSNGLYLISLGIAGVVDGMVWFYNIFNSIFPYIEPIVWAIATAFGGYALYLGIVRAVTLVATAAQWAWNAAMTANPIGLIIAAIFGLIAGLAMLIASVKPVRDIVANHFRSMGEIISGIVGWIIDTWTKGVNTFIDIVNSFLKGINKVINVVGEFIGLQANVDLELKRIDTSEFSVNVQNSIQNTFNTVADNVDNFTVENIKAKFDEMKGKLTGGDVDMTAPWNGGKNAPINDMPRNIPRVDEVGRVGAINDTVDIASEDLVTMRELAEMQSIQNFVTLTPTVQVTTGDVHREADIDILVSKIESKLEEQFTSSAQGVYA